MATPPVDPIPTVTTVITTSLTRMQVLGIWLMCVILSPVLLIAMLIQILVGSLTRAKSMGVAYDECGAALFGRPPTETISQYVGNSLIAGKHWAVLASECIDLLFGKGHCLANATVTAAEVADGTAQL